MSQIELILVDISPSLYLTDSTETTDNNNSNLQEVETTSNFQNGLCRYCLKSL